MLACSCFCYGSLCFSYFWTYGFVLLKLLKVPRLGARDQKDSDQKDSDEGAEVSRSPPRSAGQQSGTRMAACVTLRGTRHTNLLEPAGLSLRHLGRLRVLPHPCHESPAACLEPSSPPPRQHPRQQPPALAAEHITVQNKI